MSDRNGRDEATRGEDALIGLIQEQTRWGPRSAMERRAFDARLAERLLRRRSIWRRPALAFASAAAATAVLVWVVPLETPQPQDEAGRGFLSAAYYAGAADDGGAFESYLPIDYKTWADALDAHEEAADAL